MDLDGRSHGSGIVGLVHRQTCVDNDIGCSQFGQILVFDIGSCQTAVSIITQSQNTLGMGQIGLGVDCGVLNIADIGVSQNSRIQDNRPLTLRICQPFPRQFICQNVLATLAFQRYLDIKAGGTCCIDQVRSGHVHDNLFPICIPQFDLAALQQYGSQVTHFQRIDIPLQRLTIGIQDNGFLYLIGVQVKNNIRIFINTVIGQTGADLLNNSFGIFCLCLDFLHINGLDLSSNILLGSGHNCGFFRSRFRCLSRRFRGDCF